MISDIFYGTAACLGIATITGVAMIALLLLFFDHNPKP